MKQYILMSGFMIFLFIVACETEPEEAETICLPANISITLVQGAQSSKIIADFHYLPDSELLDHITWSNHQTHYFEYDSLQRMKVIRIKKVDDKVQEERWFVYDGSLVERIDLVKRNLDYTFLEPLDSMFTAYVEYLYEGENIIEEREYEVSAGGNRKEFVRKVSYEYDSRDNLLSKSVLDPTEQESTSMTMSYDQSRHPYSALRYYFQGESYVNNMLSRTEDEVFNYTYNLQLNEYEYPEIIYEKLGSAYTRIIKYSYQCR